eukprot:TRINITY_DN5731_c1_g3_i2.p1 TRINITY_DN5731_c1_g3~~TRINITY_DN5731_c1_g3_i2.p1  ORF type:complete len:136 (-),score=17.00 TRINITY_DN5731_c1_g3_i2:42-449(-)
MDGFAKSKNKGHVLVLAATNRYHALDPALTRARRFDKKIFVDLPTAMKRKAILQYYIGLHPCEKASKDTGLMKKLVDGTENWDCAALETLINEAAVLAAKKAQEEVTAGDILEAYEKNKKNFMTFTRSDLFKTLS